MNQIQNLTFLNLIYIKITYKIVKLGVNNNKKNIK